MIRRIKNTEKLVKKILTDNKKTRGNDDLLYLEVINSMNMASHTFDYIFRYRSELGIPPFETVRRSRQKIQAEYPELKPSKAVQDKRDEAEEIMREWANGNL